MSLVAQDIHFAYPGGSELYGGLSLRVEPSERVALAAPSGAGKTTFCRILAGYIAPRQGSVTVDGMVVAGGQHPRGFRVLGITMQLHRGRCSSSGSIPSRPSILLCGLAHRWRRHGMMARGAGIDPLHCMRFIAGCSTPLAFSRHG